jgi:MraZ protein
MLLGEYEHTIDDKNRLTFPAKFRRSFADGVVLTRGMDGCVYAYPRPRWQELVDGRLAGLDPLSGPARQLQRFVFGGAHDDDLDRQGRVVVPTHLIRHGRLGREVVVVGVNDRVEIWDRAVWAEHVKEVEGSVEDVAERLATQRD